MIEDYVLYILMRKDMDSLNHPGKMVAQGAHAANHAADSIGRILFGAEMRSAWMTWEKSTLHGFGTTIVLGGITEAQRVRSSPIMFETVLRGLTINDIRAAIDAAIKMGFAGAIINDPTYPLLDGKTMHGFPCDTCGWIFGSKTGLQYLLRNLVLHSDSVLL